MRTRQLRLAVCLWMAVCLLIFGCAMAAEYYVSPTGKDAHAGTKAAPWQTLAKASAVVTPGDTVYLGAGAYRETLRPTKSGEADRTIRFVAMPTSTFLTRLKSHVNGCETGYSQIYCTVQSHQGLRGARTH